MSQFQILGRRPFPFKAIPIRFAYTNFPDTIDLDNGIGASSSEFVPDFAPNGRNLVPKKQKGHRQKPMAW